jgi:hypothetical protein
LENANEKTPAIYAEAAALYEKVKAGMDAINAAKDFAQTLTNEVEDAKAIEAQAQEILTTLQADAAALTAKLEELAQVAAETEPPTTEEPTTEEQTTEPDNSWDVDFSKAPISGSYAEPWAGNQLIPSLSAQDLIYVVHYGSINLGEVDLSKYSKVTVTYATPVGGDSAGGDFAAQYEATAKRVMLLNTASAIQDGSAFEYLPEESAIIASAQYSMSATHLALTTVEIDLSAIDYNGQTYLTFDFRDANNAFGATSYLIVVTDIVFQ